jgi:hypothetical protein
MLRPSFPHRLLVLIFLGLAPLAVRAAGVELVVELPKDLKVKGALAAATQMKLETSGMVEERTIRFGNLLPETAYDLKFVLADGMVLQGVDMAWYDLERTKPNAGELTDEDREEIRAIVQDVPSFYNKSTILRLSGTHDRAVGLLELVRDKDFHAGKGEVIWRVELWYFKFQAGGWEAVGQQNKVLRRERFKTRDEYQAALGKVRWVPEIGGIRIGKGEASRRIILPLDIARPGGERTSPIPATGSAR